MSKGSVLIVEDERSVAAFTQVCLERMGYSVCGVAPTGEEALTRAGAERPDLVLMDIGLAGALGGIETAQKLRFGFNIPVIYLTGSADPATLVQTRETEAIGYVLKPFDLPTLQTTVETALHQFRLAQA